MIQAQSGLPRTQTHAVDVKAIDALRAQLHGPLLLPSDEGYDDARRIWNGMIDRQPALIARCRGVADVVDAVNFARTHGLRVAVRGGGHNVAGNAVCDGGLMIDLSLMRGVWVDPETQTAQVQGGATWGDVDRETQLFGLATPGGIVSTTGVAGLTLGGGYGYLRKQYGLSCDNLRVVEMVTADGSVGACQRTGKRRSLLGHRGGGGNFGIVTSFHFQLHGVGPEALHLPVLYPAERSREILRKCFNYMATAPDELSIITPIFNVPAGPPIRNICMANRCCPPRHAGPTDREKRLWPRCATWTRPTWTGRRSDPIRLSSA